MSKSKFSLLLTAGVMLAMAMVVATPATANPFLLVRVVDSADSSSHTVASVGDVIDIKIQFRLADLGAVNNGPPARTITTLVSAVDGLGTIRLDVKEATTEQIQVGFDAAGSLQNGLNAGIGASPGTLTNRGNTYNDLIGLVGVLAFGQPYLGVPALDTTAWTTAATAQVVVKALGTGAASMLNPGYWLAAEGGSSSAGSIKINNGAVVSMSQTAADQYFNFLGLEINTGGGPTPPAWGDGTAQANDSGTGALGPALIAMTPLGSNYNTLVSHVVGTTGGPGGLPMVGSTATILAGMNETGADTESHAAWRTGLPGTEDFLLSDVLSLTFMANASEHGQTDPFVLAMTYDPALLPVPADEEVLAAAGDIQLQWLDGTSWENAILGNFGDNVGVFKLGPWAGETALGSWGVDTENNVVWAVVNHNSLFAAAPEPATMGFLALGGLAMAGMGLRRRNRKS